MKELFQNILTASFQGSIVILAVIALRLILKKAPKKFFCLLWLLALVRLLVPFEIQSNLSLQPDTAAVAQQQVQIMDTWMVGYGGPAPVEGAGGATPEVLPAAPKAQPVEMTPAPISEPEKTKASLDWKALVPIAWLAVAGCFVLSSVYAYLRLKYRVREAVKIPGGWECENIETAFILGFFRPRIYIPMGMSPSNRKYILAHERTHLEKGDHWFKMAGYLALAIHWFNPLVWVAYILLCKDIEMACDERVVRSMGLEERKHYSAALLSCSTNRAHFAACPVAFGEVSVRERIRSVLNYRKPGFWVSLFSVAAIVFVAVCLLTSPRENGGPAAGDTTPTGETQPEKKEGFASNLSQEDIAGACEQAILEMKTRENYCVQMDYSCTNNFSMATAANSSSVIRRHGENGLSVSKGENGVDGGWLVFEGTSATYWGDAWVRDTQLVPTDPNAWTVTLTPGGKTITFPQGTGILSGDRVSYHAVWMDGSSECSGDFTYTFRDDGTLAAVHGDYVETWTEEQGSGEMHYVQTVTILDEPAEETYNQIKSYFDQSISQEELEAIRRERETVTEVPSNKTDYDKDFALGSSQMGWQMMDGEWFFKFGAEDVTETGARLVVDVSAPYGENQSISGTVRCGDRFFVERLDGDTWVEVPVIGSEPVLEKTAMPWQFSLSIDWSDSYGALPAGRYRVGSYYTFTADDGRTDTKVCYAKFRLYDEASEALLLKCKNGLADLLASDSYHLLATHFSPFQYWGEDDYYYASEVWKHGGDYLEENRYYYYRDDSLHGVRSSMRRDGVDYNLEHENDSCRNPVTSWKTNTYADERTYQMWSWSYEIYGGHAYEEIPEGNQIILREKSDFYEDYPYTEMAFTFDGQDRLIGLSQAFVAENGDRVVDDEVLLIQEDTPEQIGAFIDGQNVSTPMAFSYDSDVKASKTGGFTVRTEGFVNTAPRQISGPGDAMSVAMKDCSLSTELGAENETNKTAVFYDPDAKMWKVEFSASWDDSIYEAVYMTDQGVTQMTLKK